MTMTLSAQALYDFALYDDQYGLAKAFLQFFSLKNVTDFHKANPSHSEIDITVTHGDKQLDLTIQELRETFHVTDSHSKYEVVGTVSNPAHDTTSDVILSTGNNLEALIPHVVAHASRNFELKPIH